MKDDLLISLFVSIDGLSFGVGDPDADSPFTAEFCLLCGETERPITLDIWRTTLREMDEAGYKLEEACEKIVEEYGGRVILEPSKIHKNDIYVVMPPEGEYEA